MKLLKFVIFCTVLIFPAVLSARVQPTSAIRVWNESGQGMKDVTLDPFIPENGNVTGDAVIICPGGSYFWLASETEGSRVAEWLCSNGIAAFVLKYRVGGKFNFFTDFRFLYPGHQYPAMLRDAQRAIQIVRSRSSEFGLDADSIGILGFSAGGHLAMLTAEHSYEVSGTGSDVSAAPDFVAMIYPVVSMSDSVSHKRSRRGLMGLKSSDKVLRDVLSLERHVPEECCPVFIVNCEDDPVVDYRNSVLMYEALSAKSISCTYVRYASGGHGFGIDQVSDDEVPWTLKFLSWLGDLKK